MSNLRQEILHHGADELASAAARLFDIQQDALQLIPGYEGCANLVYACARHGQPYILRVSYRPDRNADQIQAELHYINYLADHGVRAARPVASGSGRLLETLEIGGFRLFLVAFVRGKGVRLPDNGYRYREGVPINEYFRNWGRMLGQMHALAKGYQPISEQARRPAWADLHSTRRQTLAMVGERLPEVYTAIESLFGEILTLPRDQDCYGLIHGDFNDGNFTVDFDTGEITVFDFDDSCYFWFLYELAAAWEGGIGRVMFEPVAQRQDFMSRYMEQVMIGYDQENSLSEAWMARLPLFIKLIQVEEFLHFVQYLDSPDLETQSQLAYKIKCIEEGIPYMGFFDPIYSPAKPFSL